jgi:succinyl-CoA synthetase beta subunit
MLAEINPLVITKDKKLIALDGKMMIDDNALFRHPELAEMRDTTKMRPPRSKPANTGCPSSNWTATSAAWSTAQGWP